MCQASQASLFDFSIFYRVLMTSLFTINIKQLSCGAPVPGEGLETTSCEFREGEWSACHRKVQTCP